MHVGQVVFSSTAPWFSATGLRFGCNGKDVAYFDFSASKYVASIPQVEAFIRDLNHHNPRAIVEVNKTRQFIPLFAETVYRDVLTLNVKPSITITSMHLNEGEKPLVLVCRVDGFYPRDINATWQQNGEAIGQEVLRSSILPNPDGAFQIRLQVNVDPSRGDTYTCQLEHRSVPGKLSAVWVPKSKNLPVHGYVVGIMAGIVGITIAVSGGVIRWKEHHTHGSEPVPNQRKTVELSDACVSNTYSGDRSEGGADHLCEGIGRLLSPVPADETVKFKTRTNVG
ncbi:class II histocompatibility antigen, B-L beta chain-like isoform X2 [Pristis pectinata]|nr:class II histocompatibility antigen, B-L beta chain-like isoform X2 [Pristis pectinata]